MIRGFAKATAMDAARRRLLLACACPLVLACACLARTTTAMGRAGGEPTGSAAVLGEGSAKAGGQIGQPVDAVPGGGASATLKQCLTAVLQGERTATFAGEMTAIADSVRMAIQIDVQVQLRGEEVFRPVSAPGLGSWRVSDLGVKAYRYLRQVTGLTAPASYRAVVRFRWLNARNRQIKLVERQTPRCEQPAHPSAAPGSSGRQASPSAAVALPSSAAS